ncbi:uncharacterized protein LOC117907534 [Vitis riparia]|uniref:uncharacterized protein LOC117907534 n=1 Tax=Vitis riparia TaxID=96939 RepID=UPI00155AAC0B|nr:uncharacterized protein LOC117907534 [Vitis riparia]
MSSEIDKELNEDSMLMHKSRHIHCDSVETLTVDGENGPRFQNESLEGYKVHDWNMNETAINEEDYRMNTNPTSDKQVTQIGSFRTGSAQSAEILTMIDTNRHGSIEKVVHKVFPHARHGVCTYHVGQNLKTKFKNPAIHKLFHDAAHAYRVSEFNFIFGQLEMIDPRAARYLMDIGVDQWARSYSTGKRYNIMTTGIVESLNAVLKNARDLPVLQLVEELRNLLQKWFVTRQQQAMSMSTELTMWADGELHSRYNMSATYLVEPINSKECNVNYVGISAQVNLDTRSCTCRQFDLDHIPCAHAIAACRFYNISCYTLCSKYFITKALLSSYSECIYPTGNEIDWVVPNHIRDKVVLPPKTRRPTGRPRKVRIPSGGEGKRTSRCSRCGQYGHNRKTCKRPIP